MKIRIPHSAPSLAVSGCALFVALGGTGYAAAYMATANNARHLGGEPPWSFARSSQIASSHGERFLSAGQEALLGKAGQFTFYATCKSEGGENVVSFDVVSSRTADLDGNGPMAAGSKIVIHEDSDAKDSTTEKPLHSGELAQVGSASDSTEIGANGEEADIFYNDGVNWPAGNGSPAHDCFAGYNGQLAR
ncbi:MAG: hypothetical protein FWD42_03240 [Solirubrobacterales bacterium]|nr:hypothetical protein [Solirubrobacterales bacterium]